MKRQQRRKAERGGPKPLHKTFREFVITNREMRRDKKTIRRMLAECQKEGDMIRHARIMAECGL